MTELAWPFPTGLGADVTAQQWRQLEQQGGTPGVIPGYNNELLVAAASGMQTTLQTGMAVAFGTAYENSGAMALTHADNASGSDRYDVVAIRYSWALDTAQAVIIAGTPGAGIPALTQSIATVYELGLAAVRVGAGVVAGSGNILSGDVFPLLDRWISAPGDVPTGTIIDWAGAETAVPRGWVLAAGQSILQIQVPRLTAVSPAWSAGLAYGRYNALGVVVIADTRGRVRVAPDNLGVAAGVQGSPAGRLAYVTATAGQVFGSENLAAADLPPVAHQHSLPSGTVGGVDGLSVMYDQPFSSFSVAWGASNKGSENKPVAFGTVGNVAMGNSGLTGTGNFGQGQTGHSARVQPSMCVPAIVKVA